MKNRIFSISLAVVLVLNLGLIGCGGEEAPEITEYNLTISSTEGGSVTTPGQGTGSFIYDEGEVVNLVAEPDEGYCFVNWSGDVDTIDDVEDASTTIIMTDDYSITANFIKQYDLAISSTAGGSVTTPGEGTYAYDEGKVVNLIVQAEGGYHFVNWTGDMSTIANVNATRTSITMLSDYTITANFTVDLYFWTDATVALNGPVTLLPEERDPCIQLAATTNMVVNSVRVDLPDGRSLIIPPYSDVFSPESEGTTVLRFYTCEPGMPTAGGEYIFTGLDVAGEPLPGARNTDIWVGVESPDPPINVRVEVVENGILVSWDESPIVPGSFEPTTKPQLGCYQLIVSRIETGVSVYGANGIPTASYLIPRNKADFIEGKDSGLSLSEMEDGAYRIDTRVLSVAPEDSLGTGLEHNNSDPGQSIIFTIRDGEITIK